MSEETLGEYAVQVGARMRDARKARGLSLDDVETASRGRFRAARLSSWERGQRGLHIPVLAQYADWLGVDITTLLPPEKPARHAHRKAATEAAERLVTLLTASYRTLGRPEAAALLADILRDGESAA